MPNVTPTGQRGASQASLQNASQSVQQGGASASQSMGNLGAILASLNQQIAQAFMKQQKQFEEQQNTLVQAATRGVENVSNQFTTAIQRKQERADNLSNSKTMVDYSAQKQKEAVDEQRDFAARQEALRAQETAAIQEETGKLTKLLAQKTQQAQELDVALTQRAALLSDAVGKGLMTPDEYRAAADQTISWKKNLSALYTQLPEIEESVAALKTKMSADFASQRASMDPNPNVALGPKPMGVITGSGTEPAVPFQRKSDPRLIPDFDTFQDVPDAQTVGLTLQMDLNNRENTKIYNRQEQLKKLQVGVYKFKESVAPLAKFEESVRKQMDTLSEESIKMAFVKAAALPSENLQQVRNSRGEVVAELPKPNVMMDLVMTDMMEKYGLAQQWKDYKAGKLVIDSTEKMPLGIAFTAAQQQIAARLSSARANMEDLAPDKDMGKAIGVLKGGRDGWLGGGNLTAEGRAAIDNMWSRMEAEAMTGETYLLSQPAFKALHKAMNSASGLARLTGMKKLPASGPKLGPDGKPIPGSEQASLFGVEVDPAELAARGPLAADQLIPSGDVTGPPAPGSFTDAYLGLFKDTQAFEGSADNLLESFRKHLAEGTVSPSTQALYDSAKQRTDASAPEGVYWGFGGLIDTYKPPAQQPSKPPGSPMSPEAMQGQKNLNQGMLNLQKSRMPGPTPPQQPAMPGAPPPMGQGSPAVPYSAGGQYQGVGTASTTPDQWRSMTESPQAQILREAEERRRASQSQTPGGY